MEYLVFGVLAYIAAGAAFFAHPIKGVEPAHFTWRGQWAIFVDTLPAVLTWPIALWHLRRE
jgi:hypothetical protein